MTRGSFPPGQSINTIHMRNTKMSTFKKVILFIALTIVFTVVIITLPMNTIVTNTINAANENIVNKLVPVPVILYGDHVHDDSPAFTALFTNKPVINKSYGQLIVYPNGDFYLNNGIYLLNTKVDLRDAVVHGRIINAIMDTKDGGDAFIYRKESDRFTIFDVFKKVKHPLELIN